MNVAIVYTQTINARIVCTEKMNVTDLTMNIALFYTKTINVAKVYTQFMNRNVVNVYT